MKRKALQLELHQKRIMRNFPIHNFPLEIAILFFKYLDFETLYQCMFVSKKWQELAEKAVTSLNLWDKMIETKMVNKGLTFSNKSVLNKKQAFKNFILYNYIAMANITKIYEYKVPKVEKIIVCRDKLILVTDLRIYYYDIMTYMKTKTYKRTCLDFDENNELIAEIVKERNNTTSLYLYRKTNTETSINKLKRAVVIKVNTFRFKEKWETELMANINHTTGTIHISNKQCHVVNNTGMVWRANTNSKSCQQIYDLKFPWNTTNTNCMVVFHKHSVALPVHSTDQRLTTKTYCDDPYPKLLLYRNMSCGVDHGDILIIGFSDGGVEVSMPEHTCNEDSKLYFNIRNFLEEGVDYEILTINVWEAINSHILFIGTRDCVYQFKLEHP